jgi:gluconolactonase
VFAHTLISSLFAIAATAVVSGELPENPIFPKDAQLELIFNRQAKLNSGLTEGPTVAPDGSIYFTDLPIGTAEQTMIHRFDPKTEKTTLFTRDGSKASGLAFDTRGRLVACDGADGGSRSILRWGTNGTSRDVVADRFKGRRLNAPNDLCVDKAGRIYFTDPRYLGSEPEEQEHRAVYRVETDGSVTLVTDDVEMPNGIALSSDETVLYVGDHNNGGSRLTPNDPEPKRGVMRLYGFPLDSDGLVNGVKRTLIDFGEDSGCDGITLDKAGHIYVTCRSLAKPGVMVIDKDGNQLAFLPTGPEHQTGTFEEWRGIPSNVEFGTGQDAHTLYVTIDKALYRVRTKQQGPPPVWSDTTPAAEKE